MEAPQKIKNKTTIQFSDFTPGYLSKENENTNSKRYMHPYVHCSIIYNSQDMEATWVPINRQVDREYIYYSSIKKNEILPLSTTWMDLEDIMLSEISQTEKDKYCMILLTCGI